MCLILVECHKPCFKVQVILLGGSFGYGYLLNFNCRNLKFQNREDHVNIHSTSTHQTLNFEIVNVIRKFLQHSPMPSLQLESSTYDTSFKDSFFKGLFIVYV